MKAPRSVLLLLALLLGAGSAFADRDDRHYDGRYRYGHHDRGDGPRTSFSLSIGTPWPAPVTPLSSGWYATHRWPHYPPVWAPVVTVPPTVVITRPDPVVYVERNPVPASPPVPALEPGFWYYCYESQAYYPQVRQCAGDWRRVAPVR